MFKGATGQGNLFDLDAFTFDTGTRRSGEHEAVEGCGVRSVPGRQRLAGQRRRRSQHLGLQRRQSNQQWTSTAAGELRVYGGKCLDVTGGGTADGTAVHRLGLQRAAPPEAGAADADGTVTAVGRGQVPGRPERLPPTAPRRCIWTCSGGTNQRWTRV